MTRYATGQNFGFKDALDPLKVEIVMLRAARVELGRAVRTCGIRRKILIDLQLMPAYAAKHRLLRELARRPNSRFVISRRGVAVEARIPPSAAFEFDRDDVEW